MTTSAERFKKAYDLGYKDGFNAAPRIVQLESAHDGNAPIVAPRPLAIADMIQERFTDAAKISQRPMNYHADLQTPLAISAAGGGLVFVSCTVVIGGGIALFIPDPSFKMYAGVLWGSAVAGILVTAANWFGNSKLRTMAMYSLENVIGKDIDGDGAVGKPLDSVDAPMGRQMFQVSSGRQVNIDVPLTKGEAGDVYAELRKNGWHFSRKRMAGIISQKKANELSGAMNYYEFYGDSVNNQLNDAGRSFWASVAKKATAQTPPPH